ncbi:hypothetical protein [Leucobacter komagatae]|uniref:Lipoprotein n=1 Tax=Leucobacter komagatae TaxID=55969 RepID=A0A0D0IK92_9MICO|nr:hypothetical protein [Leucobacter komagatae]KIP52019.1 hypothetical protein SD72_11815 [Leucobacter komagatae]
MSPLTNRRTSATVAVAALLITLTGCSAIPLGPSASSGSVQVPNRIGPEGCGISSERITSLLDSATAQLGTVQESVLAGEVPDLAALVAPFEGDLASLTQEVTDPQALAALEAVQTALTGFGDIPAPGNVLEAPGYVQEITGQIAQLRDAGTALQQLCSAP